MVPGINKPGPACLPQMNLKEVQRFRVDPPTHPPVSSHSLIRTPYDAFLHFLYVSLFSRDFVLEIIYEQFTFSVQVKKCQNLSFEEEKNKQLEKKALCKGRGSRAIFTRVATAALKPCNMGETCQLAVRKYRERL